MADEAPEEDAAAVEDAGVDADALGALAEVEDAGTTAGTAAALAARALAEAAAALAAWAATSGASWAAAWEKAALQEAEEEAADLDAAATAELALAAPPPTGELQPLRPRSRATPVRIPIRVRMQTSLSAQSGPGSGIGLRAGPAKGAGRILRRPAGRQDPCPAKGNGGRGSRAAAEVAPIAYRSRFADARIDRLFEAILALQTPEDCYRFFEDLCTVGEIQALAQRLHAAELLRQGATYEVISVRTGMSSATISRIKRFLLYGAEGYRLVLDRLAAPEREP